MHQFGTFEPKSRIPPQITQKLPTRFVGSTPRPSKKGPQVQGRIQGTQVPGFPSPTSVLRSLSVCIVVALCHHKRRTRTHTRVSTLLSRCTHTRTRTHTHTHTYTHTHFSDSTHSRTHTHTHTRTLEPLPSLQGELHVYLSHTHAQYSPRTRRPRSHRLQATAPLRPPSFSAECTQVNECTQVRSHTSQRAHLRGHTGHTLLSSDRNIQ